MSGELAPSTVDAAAPPPAGTTQAQYPWRAVARTMLAAIISLATLVPSIVAALDVDVSQVPPWVAGLLACAVGVAGAVTRVLAIPAVEAWLRKYIGGLAAAPTLQPPAGDPDDLLSEYPPSR